ncbi:predicted protein [Histoplasma mississippiense (nom. inval.)]|uniref:predicted protein n=1 Tax=Ajellomyces capsulatus (strain NAm1 / WU24) TaxID=2059318 RepID=UPI000157D26D|nr:predicted protein [Histoplasma mississippiense (nom. inval.)]EDN04408.1 predicted protein [Histoplasma mississippiense (nom. inval.)]
MTSQIPTPTLLLNSLPPKTLIGIDLLSFTSTPNFHGIKNLPPGPHFLFTDIRLRQWDAGAEALIPIDESSEAGKRDAMKLRANLGRIWASGGLLAYDRATEEQRQRAQDNNHPLNSVGDYHRQQKQELESESSQESPNDWPQLTDHITPALLSRILGSTPTATPPTTTAVVTTKHGDILTSQPLRWTVSSGSSAVRDRDDIPGLSTAEVARAYDTGIASEQEKELRFLPVDLKRTWRAGAVGRERTEAAQDRSWALGDLVGRFGQGVSDTDNLTATAWVGEIVGSTTGTIDGESQEAGEAQILGELQFTFLMVLTLMNFSCQEQWKRLLGLVLTCRAAVLVREKFFVQVLRLLRLQLKHFDDVEGGLFDLDGDDGEAEGQLVRQELEKLENWVKGRYGWELRPGATVKRGMLELEDGEQVEVEISGANEEDEMGEYAPVIVDLGEGDSLEKGLVEEVEEDEEAGHIGKTDH